MREISSLSLASPSLPSGEVDQVTPQESLKRGTPQARFERGAGRTQGRSKVCQLPARLETEFDL